MHGVVNIVLSDRGWILERLAKEITDRLSYTSYSTSASNTSKINYYMTYSSRHSKMPGIEVAFFTHIEQDLNAAAKFHQIARDVDHCVCMSNVYADMLREAGIARVTTIKPGVDLEAYRPRLRIGVVGRTYHTGRKGEAIVASLMTMPDIDWVFTGEGWPGPALNLPAEDLPTFYRSLDYVLVPSLYEGGPMCVLEALACGTEIIAPPIGFVPDYPHIEFPVGDVDALRRILNDLMARKARLRESVLGDTWDRWASEHDRLFHTLLPEGPAVVAATAPDRGDTQAVRRASVILLMHGPERGSAGGPSLRVPRTADELRLIGVDAKAEFFPTAEIADRDIVHGFNTWTPSSALALCQQAKRLGKSLVFSPIFLDLSGIDVWRNRLPDLFRAKRDRDDLEAAIDALCTRYKEVTDRETAANEPELGYHALVREIVELSDHVILLSDHERRLLARIGALLGRSSVVRNPVDYQRFAEADPSVFKNEYGIDDYVLCVARVEPRKNQLMLLQALRDVNIPVVLIGHVSQPSYGELVQSIAGPNVHLIGRLASNSPLLASAIAGARAFVLPSWAEGAPLAALEAAAAGVPLVLSDRSGEAEYFGELARYVYPGDLQGMREAILEAYESHPDAERRRTLQEHVATKFSWQEYARETAAVYASLSRDVRPRAKLVASVAAVSPARATGEIVMDLTTSAEPRANRSGINRVERALAEGLAQTLGIRIRFVVWDQPRRRFREVPASIAFSDQFAGYCAMHLDLARPQQPFKPGSPLLVCGSGWMQNNIYAEALAYFAGHHQLDLSLMVHDLTPILFPFWFEEGYSARFEANFDTVATVARRLLVYSDNTRRDVEQVANERNLSIGTIGKFRLFDDMSDGTAIFKNHALRAHIDDRFENTPFVLNVGAIHARKNHRLLYDAWLSLVGKLGERCPHLVIVGGVGWNGADLARAMREDKRINRFIHILENVDDDDLNWLFARCLFTVYPSLYEGWGLPVAESLAFGKICLASNNSSIVEIAPALTDLLDPSDLPAWVAKLQFYATSRSARDAREAEIRSGYKPTTRAESAAQIVRALAGPIVSTDRFLYALGQPIAPGRHFQAVRTRLGGWYPSERWGSWAAEEAATLRFDLARLAGCDLLLIAEVRMLATTARPRVCNVRVAGQGIAVWSFTESGFSVRTAFLPAALVAGCCIEVELQVDTIQAVAQFSTSQDPRSVGIGLGRVALLAAEREDEIEAVRKAYTPKTGPWANTVPPGRPLRFAELARRQDVFPAGTPAILPGWGAICDERGLSIELLVIEKPASSLTISVRVRAVATAQNPRLIMVIANGERLDVWRFEDDQVVTREVGIPVELRHARQPLLLEFFSHQPSSPRAIGLGREERRFAMGIYEAAYRLDDETPTLPEDYPIYELGQTVDFSATPRAGAVAAGAFLDGGWYRPERDGTWALGKEGKLAFKLKHAPPATLVAIVEGGMYDALEGNELLAVAVDGEERGARSFALNRRSVNVFDLGPDFRREDEIRLTFRTVACASPASLGVSNDERPLGFRLRTLELRDLPASPLPARLDLGSALLTERVILMGWHPAEANELVSWRWTRGASGAVFLRLLKATGGIDLAAAIACAAAAPDTPKTVEFHVNGRLLAQRILSDNGVETALIQIPGDVIALSSILELRLVQPEPFRPTDLDGGDDGRSLGVQLFDLELWPIGTYAAEPVPAEVLDMTANNDAAPVPAVAGLTLPADLWGASEETTVHAVRWENWHDRERDGGFRWSAGEAGIVKVLLHERAMRDGFSLAATIGVHVATPAHPRPIEVLVNGHSFARYTLIDHLAVPVHFAVPAEVAAAANPVEIRFEQSAPFSPAELHLGADSRILGLQMYALRVAAIASEVQEAEPPELAADAYLQEEPGAEPETIALDPTDRPSAEGAVADAPRSADQGGEPDAQPMPDDAVDEWAPIEGEYQPETPAEPPPRLELLAADGSAFVPYADALTELMLPFEIPFGRAIEPQTAMLVNWHDGEGEYRWSAGAEATFFVRVDDAAERGFTIEATISTELATAEHPKTVEIVVNGCLLWTRPLAGAQPTRCRFLVPPEVAGLSVPIAVVLAQREPFCPAGIGIGTDERLLGVKLHDVKFSAIEEAPLVVRQAGDGVIDPPASYAEAAGGVAPAPADRGAEDNNSAVSP